MVAGGKNIDNDIERYLFVEMSDEERDSFEERMFGDDDLFIEVADAENRLVDEYAASGLAAKDVTRFERSLELVPARRQKLANARAIGEFIEENRPPVLVAEPKQSFLGKLAGLFTINTPAFGMAAAGLVVLLFLSTGILFVQNRRKESDIARLHDLQTELDQSRQREQELQTAVNTEREASGDFVEELDRERQHRDQIERELQQLKQKPVESAETPVVATAFLLPIGGRGGGGGSIVTIKIGPNTKRVALSLSLPEEIGADERLAVSFNKRSVASGLKLRVSRNRKTLNVTISVKELMPGLNEVRVSDEQGRDVGNYGLNKAGTN